MTGASRGIGRGIACRLSQDGFTVVINDLPSQRRQLEEVQAYITQQGGKALTFLADVSNMKTSGWLKVLWNRSVVLTS